MYCLRFLFVCIFEEKFWQNSGKYWRRISLEQRVIQALTIDAAKIREARTNGASMRLLERLELTFEQLIKGCIVTPIRLCHVYCLKLLRELPTRVLGGDKFGHFWHLKLKYNAFRFHILGMRSFQIDTLYETCPFKALRTYVNVIVDFD